MNTSYDIHDTDILYQKLPEGLPTTPEGWKLRNDFIQAQDLAYKAFVARTIKMAEENINRSQEERERLRNMGDKERYAPDSFSAARTLVYVVRKIHQLFLHVLLVSKKMITYPCLSCSRRFNVAREDKFGLLTSIAIASGLFFFWRFYG